MLVQFSCWRAWDIHLCMQCCSKYLLLASSVLCTTYYMLNFLCVEQTKKHIHTYSLETSCMIDLLTQIYRSTIFLYNVLWFITKICPICLCCCKMSEELSLFSFFKMFSFAKLIKWKEFYFYEHFFILFQAVQKCKYKKKKN